jgi:transcriptional regulator with XRE-family HTH domain
MQSAQNWREYLSELIAVPGRREQICQALGIVPITLNRWVNGESRPRSQTLHRLLQILPDHRERLLSLLHEEFPEFSTSLQPLEQELLSIPSEFYRRILRTKAYAPTILRFNAITELVVQEALKQLDPARRGMSIIVVCCMAPSIDGKVRSLLWRIGRGVPPWSQVLEQQPVFFGIESLVGHAVTSGHLVYNPRLEEFSLAPEYHHEGWEASALAVPIMCAGEVAGGLLSYSAESDYFTSSRVALLEAYAELLALAFVPDQFYSHTQIALGLMPSVSVQRPLLATFQRRVNERMTRAIQRGRLLSVLQAEQEVWQQIEESLLQISVSTSMATNEDQSSTC